MLATRNDHRTTGSIHHRGGFVFEVLDFFVFTSLELPLYGF